MCRRWDLDIRRLRRHVALLLTSDVASERLDVRVIQSSRVRLVCRDECHSLLRWLSFLSITWLTFNIVYSSGTEPHDMYDLTSS